MQTDTLEIRPDIRAGLHALAEETHRAEADILNEALATYVARERRILADIREGLAQAERGEFVSDQEMDAFFALHGEPEA